MSRGRGGEGASRGAVSASYVVFVLVLISIGVLSGCDRPDERATSAEAPIDDKARLWSYLTADDGNSAKITKWEKSNLSILLVVDDSHTPVLPSQFSTLFEEFGVQIGLPLAICTATTHASASVPIFEDRACEQKPFDLYMVVSNGAWSRNTWFVAKGVLATGLRRQYDTLVSSLPASVENSQASCRYALKIDESTPGRIRGAVSVINSTSDIATGRCAIYMIVNMLGLMPFDGQSPLDPSSEADSLASFLLKSEPFGAAYLARALYDENILPGMTRADFEAARASRE